MPSALKLPTSALTTCSWNTSRTMAIGLAPVALPERQPRQVQHVEDVGVVQLRLEREPQDVEVPHGRERLDREERNAALAHLALQVDPGRVHALAREFGPPVHQLVEDLQARVAHSDLVRVGKRQGQRHARRGEVLAGQVALETHIAPRLLHGREKGVQTGAQGLVSHGTVDSTGRPRPGESTGTILRSLGRVERPLKGT